MAEACTSQTDSTGDLRNVKKEKDDNCTEGHLHFFSFEYEKGEKKMVCCKRPCTVLEALESHEDFKYPRDETTPIIKMGGDKNDGIIATHFPCHLIDKKLVVSFAPAKGENVHHPDVLRGASYVTFCISTTGGENTRTKDLFRNSALKKMAFVRVYAERGSTVKEALKRDGRFLDYVTDKFNLCYGNPEQGSRFPCSATVDALSGKHFTLSIPRGKTGKSRDAQASAKGDSEISSSSYDLRSGNTPAARMTPDTIRQRANRRVVPENVEASEDVLEALREQFPALKEWMMSRFPDDKYQKAVELKREEFGKIEMAFSEVHRMKKLMKLSDSVCMVQVGNIQGTGFVLLDNFILTNAHILKHCVQLHQDQRHWQLTKELFVLFNYENLEDFSKCVVMTAKNIIIDCEYSKDFKELKLDYAILELEPTKSIPKGLLSKCGPIPRNGGSCIIGHLAGGVKKMDVTCIIERREESVMREIEPYKDDGLLLCEIVNKLKDQGIQKIMRGGDKEEKLITYDTFMYHGASGSPVFDDNGQVIGLHTAGFVYDDKITKDTKSAIEFAHPLSLIIKNFVTNLKKRGQNELLEKVQKEAIKARNPYLCNLIQMNPDSDQPTQDVDEQMDIDQ